MLSLQISGEQAVRIGNQFKESAVKQSREFSADRPNPVESGRMIVESNQSVQASLRQCSQPAILQRKQTADRCDAFGRSACDLCVRASRQPHCKSRAFARLARHCHVAAHRAGELAGDGKAQPGATETLRSRLA